MRPGDGSSHSDRYSALARWYDTTFAGYEVGPSSMTLTRLLGRGTGPCLDVGCGTGLHFRAIRSTGRTPIGVDASPAQLEIAASRGAMLVQADARALPFGSGVFENIVSTFLHTDVEDFAGVVAGVARVLAADGRFIYVGVHPCFVHHAAERREDSVVVRSGYTEAGWHGESPMFRPNGLRARVGEWHRTLEEVLGAFIDSGLHLERIEEPTEGFGVGSDTEERRFTGVPGMIAIVARKV